MSKPIHQGSMIHKLVEKKKISIVEFAKRVGVSEQHMHRLFKQQFIHTKWLSKMAEVLDVALIPTDQMVVNEPLPEYEKTNPNNKQLTPMEMISQLQERLRLCEMIMKRDAAKIEELEEKLKGKGDSDKSYRKAN